MCYIPAMRNTLTVTVLLLALIQSQPCSAQSNPDLRGLWVGSAQGSIFGAEGSVNILRQTGREIYGIVEGGNFFGNARFDIRGTVYGNMIVGEKAGNLFRGWLYPDGVIRGSVRAIDGDTYQVVIHRPHSHWGSGTRPGW
jgi:hypothetical protein